MTEETILDLVYLRNLPPDYDLYHTIRVIVDESFGLINVYLVNDQKVVNITPDNISDIIQVNKFTLCNGTNNIDFTKYKHPIKWWSYISNQTKNRVAKSYSKLFKDYKKPQSVLSLKELNQFYYIFTTKMYVK
jgi:hypothetical protein